MMREYKQKVWVYFNTECLVLTDKQLKAALSLIMLVGV